MPPSLEGCTLKLKKADEHLLDLHKMVKEFHKAHPYSIPPDLNAETGECIFRVQNVLPAPLDWSIVIGEFAYNMRSALDHLVWQLVELDGGRPGRYTQFPIFKSRDDYLRDGHGPGMLKGLKPPNRKQIEDLQPYNTGDDAIRDPLWLLDELSNIDKHRVLHIVFAGAVDVTMDLSGIEALDVKEVRVFTPKTLENGVPVASMRLVPTGTKGKLQVKPEITHEEHFGDRSGDLRGLRMGETLQDIRNHVNTEVFPKFIPLF